MRRLYDLTIRHRGGDVGHAVTAHLDLEEDEVKMRRLLTDAVTRNNGRMREIGEYEMQVREHGNQHLLLTYVSTEVG